LADQKKKKIV